MSQESSYQIANSSHISGSDSGEVQEGTPARALQMVNGQLTSFVPAPVPNVGLMLYNF